MFLVRRINVFSKLNTKLSIVQRVPKQGTTQKEFIINDLRVSNSYTYSILLLRIEPLLYPCDVEIWTQHWTLFACNDLLLTTAYVMYWLWTCYSFVDFSTFYWEAFPCRTKRSIKLWHNNILFVLWCLWILKNRHIHNSLFYASS